MARIAEIPNPKLELRDLRVVLALDRARTTGGAAGLLHLTQSAVSRALAVAEDHAGAELFTRTAKGLQPTRAGRELIGAAPGVLAELCALERRAMHPDGGTRRLRLVASCAMIYPWLMPALVQLERNTPNLRVQIRTQHAYSALEALESGKLDAAFTTTSSTPRSLRKERLFQDELVFLVAPGHPLSCAQSLHPDDLLEHELLVPDIQVEDDWFARTLFGKRRPKLRVRRLPITEAIVELARANMGMAVLSEWLAQKYLAPNDGSLRVLRMREPPLLRQWSLLYRPEVAGLVSNLLDVVRASQPRPVDL
ncbi:MAG: LysR family transcriptional regulator [Nannocystaceae bacterium]|nr:LysR family transcriptional regulator [Nannocystaceae bacterium]